MWSAEMSTRREPVAQKRKVDAETSFWKPIPAKPMATPQMQLSRT